VALNYRDLDEAFPTLVRYSGWALTVVLIGFCLAGFYIQAAPGFVAAGGMLLYKTVRNAAEENGREKAKYDDDLSDW
jgi:hypothetical protein